MRKRIELGGGLAIAPLSIELVDAFVHREPDAFGGTRATYTFQFRVLHRDTGQICYIERSEGVLLDETGEPRGAPLHAVVQRALCDSLCHEVDEVLQINGRRILEPHK